VPTTHRNTQAGRFDPANGGHGASAPLPGLLMPLLRTILAFSCPIVGDRTDAGQILSHTCAQARRAMKDKGQSPDRHDWYARAAAALERARKMKPGAERNEALKKAGQLQTAADVMGYLKSRELRPPK
jgi:hypothetical protein